MNYLKRTRTRMILLCILISSLLLLLVPSVDIRISRIFFDKGFYFEDQWRSTWLRHAVPAFLFLAAAFVAGLYCFNRAARKNLCALDGKKLCYLVLVLVIGAGLIVNVALKDNFGRARPRDIVEFGGTKRFTPAFVISTECRKNCSFSSGEGAGAFFALTLAWALSRRRAIRIAAVAFGISVSLGRIAAGAHFFSDTVVSFFIMLIVSDVLYYHMLVPRPPAPSAAAFFDAN